MMTRRHFALASAAALAGAAGSISAAPIPKDFDTVFPQGPVNRLSKSAKSTARLLTFIRSEHSWISP